MKIYIFIISTIFCGCYSEQKEIKSVSAEDLSSMAVDNEGVQILTIDGCEYVWCKNGSGAGLTHKGNCKFCYEREHGL